MPKDQRTTASGVPMTDDLIKKFVSEAEAGHANQLTKKGGRPRLGKDQSQIVPVRMPTELHRGLLARAEAEGKNVSTVIREALKGHLAGSARRPAKSNVGNLPVRKVTTSIRTVASVVHTRPASEEKAPAAAARKTAVETTSGTAKRTKPRKPQR